MIDLDIPYKELAHDLVVIDNWRASHSYPLSIFYQTLKNRASAIHAKALTAQRIKRAVSIFSKLIKSKEAKPTNPMKLSQMQDIGGCRAILPTIYDVMKLLDLYESRKLEHQFLGSKDYIAAPKETGYRGVHLKYRYKGNGDKAIYDGLKIEIQLRTALQHTWATAVETAGTFTNQALKSNIGNKEWLRFFALMSSVFAIREKCPTVPDTPTDLKSLHLEIMDLNNRHYIVDFFSGYKKIIPHVINEKAKYFLVQLEPVEGAVNIQGFDASESQEANKAYTEMELLFRETHVQVVLVSVDSVKDLKKAYPNYFLDAEAFLSEVRKIVGDHN